MPPLRFQKMETRRLHSSEIKQLVLVLRNNVHPPVGSDHTEYEKATQCVIKRLPRRLRSTLLSSHGLLCSSHKGLDVHLINDIWAWIKFELEVAVGRFAYPIVMTDALSTSDAYRVRQLEPVVEMFLPQWTLAASAPPGKQPIDTGTKWAFQKNGCPACMLARIGSDEAALFALFAGMCSHLRSRSGGQHGVNKIKGKRLRFVRYWMRTHPNGDRAAEEAYNLGVKLKALRPDAKTTLRRAGQSTRYTRGSVDKPPVTSRHGLDAQSEIAVDLSIPFNPKEWMSIPSADSPTPVPVDHQSTTPPTPFPLVKSHTPSLGQHSTPASFQPSSMPVTESDTLTPLPQLPKPTLRRHHSVLYAPSSLSTSPSCITSIASYNAPDIGTSTNSSDSLRHVRGHDPLEAAEERVDRYRKLMGGFGTLNKSVTNPSEGAECRGRLLPKPSRGSIYAGFGVAGEDDDEEAFESVDWTPLPSPIGDGFEGVWEEEDEGGD